MGDDKSKGFRGQIRIDRGQPLKLVGADAGTASSASETPESKSIGTTLQAYRDSAKRLLSDKYQALRETAPLHMRGECDCLALICDDGVIVRWDRMSGDKPRLRVGRLTEETNTIASIAPKISEGLIFCAERLDALEIPADAVQIQFGVTDAAGQTTPFQTHRLGIVILASALREPATVRRPTPVASALNELTIEVHGEEISVDAGPNDPGRAFVARAPIRLPVGWEAIEVYPVLPLSVWDSERAADWAEVDLLANVARKNVAELTLKNLDPRSASRREFSKLLRQFEDLFDGAEAPLQAFLEAHPELLRPSYAQVWKRLPLGAHVTDFVIKEASSDYLLVEIEAPIRLLFRKDGHPREELTHAVDQVNDWIEYIQNNLGTVRRDIGLAGISATPRGLVVIGRSSDLTDDDRSKLQTLRGVMPRIDILTYDDLLATTRRTLENMLGTLPDPRTTADVYYLPPELEKGGGST